MVIGIIFVLWALGWAAGSASLGLYNVQGMSGGAYGAYLRYSPIMGVLALAFACIGVYWVYQAGKSAIQSPDNHNS